MLSQYRPVLQCADPHARSAVQDGRGGCGSEADSRATKVGDPITKSTSIGPLASNAQFEKMQRLISQGNEDGAE
jgi:Aldehyde dehydrogenase family